MTAKKKAPAPHPDAPAPSESAPSKPKGPKAGQFVTFVHSGVSRLGLVVNTDTGHEDGSVECVVFDQPTVLVGPDQLG